MPMQSRTNLTLLLFVIIGTVLFYLQDQWLIRDIDDFAFSTINELVVNDDGSRYLVHVNPVTSLGDAIKSQQAAYLDYNGRFIIHTLSQWFNGTMGTGFVALFNSVFWAMLLASFVLLSLKRERRDVPNLIIAFAVLWLLMPNAHVMMTGAITAAADYLWTGGANLLILLLFNKVSQRREPLPWLGVIALAAGATVVGAMQESFSIGIAAGMAVYCLINRKKVSRDAWLMTAFYIVGTLLITLAPANFKRSDLLGHYIRWYVFTDLLRVPVVSLTVLFTVITLALRPGIVIDVLKRNTVILVALVVNLAFAVLIAYTGPWQLTCISLLCAILLLQMASMLITGRTARVAIACVAALATVAVYATQLWHRHEMWKVEQMMYHEALNSQDGLIDLSRAFDVDKPFRESRLAPLYRQYLRNPFETLIINDQLFGVGLLSKFLTKCEDPELIKALLPASAQEIARLFDTGEKHTVGEAQAIDLYSFTITRGATDDADHITSTTVRQQWQHGGMYYKLYYGHGFTAATE